MYLFVLVIIYLILSFIDSRLFYHCIALFFLYILLVFLLWQWSLCNWGAVSVCVFWLGIFHFCHFTVRFGGVFGVSVSAILYKFWIDFFSTYSRLNGKRPKFANFAASYHGELQGKCNWPTVLDQKNSKHGTCIKCCSQCVVSNVFLFYYTLRNISTRLSRHQKTLNSI